MDPYRRPVLINEERSGRRGGRMDGRPDQAVPLIGEGQHDQGDGHEPQQRLVKRLDFFQILSVPQGEKEP